MTDAKVTSLRRYLYEYTILGLVGAVTTLFYLYIDMNNYIRTEFRKQNIEQSRVIESNTETMKDLKTYFINNKN